MANLTAGRGAEASDLADRVLREVVVQQKLSFDLALLEIVHELLVFFRAQRGRDHRLRLAARKESGAVRARQPADLAGDGPNL